MSTLYDLIKLKQQMSSLVDFAWDSDSFAIARKLEAMVADLSKTIEAIHENEINEVNEVNEF